MDKENHVKRKMTQIPVSQHFSENYSPFPLQFNLSNSTNKQFDFRISEPKFETLHRRNSSSIKQFNFFEKDNDDKKVANKIIESLKVFNILKEKLSEMMKKYEKIFSAVFDLHVTNIRKHISQRIDNLNEDNLFNSSQPESSFQINEYATKKMLKKLDSFFEFHNQMNFTLHKNLDLMKNFLQNVEFSHECPIEEFVSGNSIDIYDSWIFNNINFEKLKVNKLIEDENFPGIMKKYLYQDTTNKFKNICVKKMKNSEKNLEFDIQLICENHEILEKLIFKEIDLNDLISLFKKISESKVNLDKMKKMKFLNSHFQYSDTKLDKTFLPDFSNIEKLIFKNNLMNISMMNSLFNKINSLKIVILKKCCLSNIQIKNIFDLLSKVKTLEKLDLSYNHLTVFDLEPFQTISPIIFENLELLNLKQNNLYMVKLNSYFPNIKYFDLSSNNFCLPNNIISYQSLYNKKCLITANKNQYLIINKNLYQEYIDYLINTLIEYNYNISKLDLSFMNIENEDTELENDNERSNLIEKLVINKNIQFNFKKLNLSNGNICSKKLLTFFTLNTKLINLKILILRNNKISDDIFDYLIKETSFCNLENLEYIDLSDNNINKIQSLGKIYILLNGKKHLKKLKLSFNELEILLNNYILLLNVNNSVTDDEIDILRKFLWDMKQIVKKSVCLVFSKLIESNVADILKKNNLDKTLVFE